MALTEHEVLGKGFTRSADGYDIDEVDGFLDEVADAITAWRAAANVAPAVTSDDPAAAAGLLARAAQLHDEHIATATAQAEQMVTTARAQANELLADARAANERELGDLQATRAALQASIDELTALDVSYRARLRTELEELIVLVAPAGND